MAADVRLHQVDREVLHQLVPSLQAEELSARLILLTALVSVEVADIWSPH